MRKLTEPMAAVPSSHDTPSSANRLLSIPEAAAILRVSESTVRRFLTEGRLPRLKVGPGANARTVLRLSDVLGLVRET
jgi:excisionase family DNA binding protein